MIDPRSNRRVVLAERPDGVPRVTTFSIEEGPVRVIRPGEVLLRNLLVSVDPYVRLRMYDRESYVPPLLIGDTIPGRTISRVIESGDERFQADDLVFATGGWQEISIVGAADLHRIDDKGAPLAAHLGPLGSTGFTAYAGVVLGELERGATVVVSAAAGAVGSVAGQIARLRGCKVVGIASSEQKCRHVVERYGFDACVGYLSPDFESALADACPNGVDFYFDNVGGPVSGSVYERLNVWARVVVCGLISQYNALDPATDSSLADFMRAVLTKRLVVKGLIVTDAYLQGYLPTFRQEMTAWLGSGSIVYDAYVLDGLDRAPEAFIDMLGGKNIGKTIVNLTGMPLDLP